MLEIRTAAELNKWLNSWKDRGLSIGFVPTMGALHDGHISLVDSARKKTDKVVCSIFVNPTQFNENSDFSSYPRTPKQDLDLLEKAGCDLAFLPDLQTVYPQSSAPEPIDYGVLTNSLEGAKRPGHFDGVAQVVNRLFDLVRPDLAFFGEKDFQQLAIIRRLCEDRNDEIEIIPCAIIREESGLAMSSRNVRLSDKGRIKAAYISKIMKQLLDSAESEMVLENLLKEGHQLFKEHEEFDMEYLEVVRSNDFSVPHTLEEEVNYRLLSAVWLEGVRLIDNMELVL